MKFEDMDIFMNNICIRKLSADHIKTLLSEGYGINNIILLREEEKEHLTDSEILKKVYNNSVETLMIHGYIHPMSQFYIKGSNPERFKDLYFYDMLVLAYMYREIICRERPRTFDLHGTSKTRAKNMRMIARSSISQILGVKRTNDDFGWDITSENKIDIEKNQRNYQVNPIVTTMYSALIMTASKNPFVIKDDDLVPKSLQTTEDLLLSVFDNFHALNDEFQSALVEVSEQSVVGVELYKFYTSYINKKVRFNDISKFFKFYENKMKELYVKKEYDDSDESNADRICDRYLFELLFGGNYYSYMCSKIGKEMKEEDNALPVLNQISEVICCLARNEQGRVYFHAIDNDYVFSRTVCNHTDHNEWSENVESNVWYTQYEYLPALYYVFIYGLMSLLNWDSVLSENTLIRCLQEKKEFAWLFSENAYDKWNLIKEKRNAEVFMNERKKGFLGLANRESYKMF